MENRAESHDSGTLLPKDTASSGLASSSTELKASLIGISRQGTSAKSPERRLSWAYFWVGVLTLLLLFFLLAHNLEVFEQGSRGRSPTAPALKLEVDPEELRDELLRASLVNSEEQFRFNTLRRWKEKKASISTKANLSMAELKADFLVPLYPCSLEGRFGLWGEGGKWICLRHYGAGKKAPLVISVGSKGDTSFETAVFSRLKGFSHTYDFSLTEQQQVVMQRYSKMLKFYNAGVSGTADLAKYSKVFPEATFVTVPEMLKQIGTDYVDIFKIDCEFCEHAVVKDMVKHYTRETVPFGQIQMEIHYINTTSIQMELLLSLESLGYRMFHSEINGYWPRGYELAYIHERLVIPRFP